MKKLLIVLLLLPVIAFSQLDLKKSNIVGISYTATFDGIWGMRSIGGLQFGQFVSNKLYIGLTANFNQYRAAYSRSLPIGPQGSNEILNIDYQERVWAFGLSSKYLFLTKKFRPFIGLDAGSYLTNAEDKRNAFPAIPYKPNQLTPYLRQKVGFLLIHGKKERFITSLDFRLEQVSRLKLEGNPEAKILSPLRRGLEIGLNYRF